ncbi:MAG: DUF1508 domain-containing protein [Candidatus Obscuribacter sp.]|nr:DUF1508 domain-containing protein [Candidatus Obscuribacter sp.]
MKIAIRKSQNGEYYLRVTARNGEVIVHSETYTKKQSALYAANLLKAEAGAAQITDET